MIDLFVTLLAIAPWLQRYCFFVIRASIYCQKMLPISVFLLPKCVILCFSLKELLYFCSGNKTRNDADRRKAKTTLQSYGHELRDHQEYSKKNCHENRHPYLGACPHDYVPMTSRSVTSVLMVPGR